MITTAAGNIEGTFEIPEYRFPGTTQNPKFRTGETEFRMTSSSTNGRVGVGIVKDPLTTGNVIYHAVGILETEQETIIATRNAVVVQTEVSQTTSRDRTSTTGRVIRARPQMEDDGEENRDNSNNARSFSTNISC